MTRTTTLLSQLRKMQPRLRGLSAIGKDGEEALSLAFKTVFPGSSHLLCQIHKRDNIILKLRSMIAKEPIAKQILGDIFGITDGESRFTGVVDSLDACEFNMALENLKPKWGSLCPSFLIGL